MIEQDVHPRLIRVAGALSKLQYVEVTKAVRQALDSKDIPLMIIDCSQMRLIQIHNGVEQELAGPKWIKPAPPKGIFCEVSKVVVDPDNDEMRIESTHGIPPQLVKLFHQWCGCGIQWQQLPSISL